MPVLNTTATADISFMLLTFFLVTTSMDVDRGLVRQLPSLDDEHEKHNDFVEVERENTMAFVIDSKGKLTLNGKPYSKNYIKRSDLMQGAQFVYNMSAKPNYSRGTAESDAPYSFSKNK